MAGGGRQRAKNRRVTCGKKIGARGQWRGTTLGGKCKSTESNESVESGVGSVVAAAVEWASVNVSHPLMAESRRLARFAFPRVTQRKHTASAHSLCEGQAPRAPLSLRRH